MDNNAFTHFSRSSGQDQYLGPLAAPTGDTRSPSDMDDWQMVALARGALMPHTLPLPTRMKAAMVPTGRSDATRDRAACWTRLTFCSTCAAVVLDTVAGLGGEQLYSTFLSLLHPTFRGGKTLHTSLHLTLLTQKLFTTSTYTLPSLCRPHGFMWQCSGRITWLSLPIFSGSTRLLGGVSSCSGRAIQRTFAAWRAHAIRGTLV